MTARQRERPTRTDALQGPAVDLDRYTPAYFTFIANKLARGASKHYLETYGIGIETWRIMVMLAIEGKVTAQRVCQLIGMDKASVSRTFKSMHAQGLVSFSSDDHDGRLRHATFTPRGREMHDSIMKFALNREQAFLSVLAPGEVDVLIDLLRRLHENLPMVDATSDAFMENQRARGLVPPRGPRRRKVTTP
ncbi:MarR family winged helix-turn-helix transcriptional regulator [Pigmentiphaga kullae]|uniref:DNA-binding MarR family transcriptional regulator n=1 Tax=Pigmentiphaga kullae TaxID=151784 RepID=A0A4Q7NMT1_9BURK|nr:MarR family winged helix-turn-helix transcriptional regulator [Pigmentiphaga kullae]RZS86514.1 DNA-binding MarR family transcriptional regulator [Pigmentiphaga kullae]